jgi:CheY-like chemotaxis protein
MPTILLVGDAAGSVHALSAAIPATHTVRLVATGQAALMAAAEGPAPALLLLDTAAPVDVPVADLLSLLAAVPATAQVPVARVSLLADGTALPQVEWLTPPTPAAAELAAGILRVHAARTSSAHQAKDALRQRITDLSQQASRTLIQRQMAQQVARWLDAPPPVAEDVSRVMNEAADPVQGLRQVREHLTADTRHRLDAIEVERVLAKLSGMLDERWR